MENFNVIYKILSAMEKNMDCEDPDWSCIGAERLGVSQARWKQIMRMLVEADYITGVRISRDCCGTDILLINPGLTIEGLEYLKENSLMKKAYRLMKGVKDVTPGI